MHENKFAINFCGKISSTVHDYKVFIVLSHSFHIFSKIWDLYSIWRFFLTYLGICHQFEVLRIDFYPTALKAVGVLFSPMVSGWAGGGKKFVRAVSQKP